MKAPATMERTGFRLTEDALGVFTHTPLPVLGAYYLGTAPFLAGLITYWAAMGSSAVAHRYHAVAALGLALLFVWMKVWHCRFMQGQLAHLQQRPAPNWTAMQTLRIVAHQCFIQMTGFFTLPIAIILLMPMPWAYGFYQHVSVLDEGRPANFSALIRASMLQAGRAPKQCIIAVWLLCPLPLIFTAAVGMALAPMAFNITQDSPTSTLSIILFVYGSLFSLLLVALCPFPFAVLANVITSFILAAQLIYTLFGIQHSFVTSDAGYNELFYASAFAITYLLVDPLAKTAFVLRSFDGESRHSGMDLRLTLRRFRNAAAPLALVLLLLFTPHAAAQTQEAAAPASVTTSVAPGQLDQALDRELADSLYQWRMARVVDEAEPGMVQGSIHYVRETLGAIFTWLKDTANAIFDWIFDVDMPGNSISMDSVIRMGQIIKMVLLVLCVVLLLLVLTLIMRFVADMNRRQVAAVDSTPVSTPDLTSEETTADALPEEGWLALAQELLAKGERRLALRAYFLALLANLARRELIQIGRAKTNQEYLRELRRRAQAQPSVAADFMDSARLYEASWYGAHPVTDSSLEHMRARQQVGAQHG